ncbi:MAG: hypothetical protein ACRDGS_04225 [Chloroflexota bacterium]
MGAVVAELGWEAVTSEAVRHPELSPTEKTPTNSARVRQAAKPKGQTIRRFGRWLAAIA